MLYIRPAEIITPSGVLHDGALLTKDDRVLALGPVGEVPHPSEAQVISADGLILAPGFIDLQLNGAFGHDFTESPSTIWEVASRLPCYGVTSFLPTVITSPLETVAEAQRVMLGGPLGVFTCAQPLGLHLEGPFLNPAKRGAHNVQYFRPPDPRDIEDWYPERGVHFVTMAPELPGALDLVEILTGRGVLVSAGHSMATYEQARAAFAAGVRYGTHLFNAMPPLDHREPGLAAALLTAPEIVTGMIVDGVHTHPGVVALAWRAKGPSGLNLVTDAMAALGMPPGTYRLAENDVTTDATSARLSDGRLAGSVLSLDQAVRNLVTFAGCSSYEAIGTVTTVPSSLLNLPDRGRIAQGARADLVLLTPDLHIAATITAGRVAYSAKEAEE